MNMESRRKTLGIMKLIFSVIGLSFAAVIIYQVLTGEFNKSPYRIQIWSVVMLVYIVAGIILVHRSLAEAFGELLWGRVVYAQRGRLGVGEDEIKGLKMKVDVMGNTHTFRYTYSRNVDDAEGESVGHYVAVYKLGPFMSIDVRRRREWEENE